MIRVDDQTAPADGLGDGMVDAMLPALAERIALIVHELRSPLAATSQVVALLEHRGDEPPDPRLLEVARRQIDAGLRRVEQLLVLLRNDAGRSAVTPTPQPLREAVLELTAQERLADAAPGLLVEIDPSLWVAMDREAFAHVVENLVGNAVRHAPAGSAVLLTAEADAAEVRLRVIDQGPGVDPEVLGRAFEPFARGAGGGAGLGLTIVRHVIEAHGGRVWIELDPEAGGTSVVVALPRAEGPA